jgi:hypothetical protein
MSASPDKSSWPELVGLKAVVAKHKIMRDRPDVEVIVVPADSMVTADVNTKRVRVFINTPPTRRSSRSPRSARQGCSSVTLTSRASVLDVA